jgi:hypothetical protein
MYENVFVDFTHCSNNNGVQYVCAPVRRLLHAVTHNL